MIRPPRSRRYTLRAELLRHKKTTLTNIVYAVMAILPFVLVAAFTVAPGDAPWRGGDIEQLATESSGNFLVFVLFASCRVGLPMIVALFFGTAVAAEASWSTLKYLLALPVPRMRLLWIKAVAAWLRCALAFAILAVSATLAGCLAFDLDHAVTPTGESVSFGHCLVVAAQMLGYELVHLVWVGAAALAVSVTTNRPVFAWALPLAGSNLSQILDELPLPEHVKQLLPSHFGFAWMDLTGMEPVWDDVIRGACSALVYGTIFYALAAHLFRRRDIEW